MTEDNYCTVAPLSKQFERPSLPEILHPTETKVMKRCFSSSDKYPGNITMLANHLNYKVIYQQLST